MNDANTALVTRFVQEVFDRGNLDAIDEFLAPDAVYHEPPPGVTPDREGLREMAAQVRAGFPDTSHTVKLSIAEGDKVAQMWVNRATHHGEFMGIPATGRPVEIRGFTLYRVAGGRITDLWDAVDLLGLMTQLQAPARA